MAYSQIVMLHSKLTLSRTFVHEVKYFLSNQIWVDVKVEEEQLTTSWAEERLLVR